VGGCAPRAPEDSVRPRRLLDASGPPLNFTVLGIVNAINVIAPYRYLGMWVFDDASVGLVQEPFVSGADAIIDRAVADIPDAQSGFLMLFSSSPFSGPPVSPRVASR